MDEKITTLATEESAALPVIADGPRRDANWCIALALGTIFFAMAGTEVVLFFRIDLVARGWFVLLFAQWGASVIFGLSALGGAANQPESKAGIFRAVAGILLSCICMLLGAEAIVHDQRFRAVKPHCQNNLKHWALFCKMYASEAADSAWPPLQKVPGNLSVDFSTVVPDYVPDPSGIWQCPETPASRIAADPASELFPALADASYFYLGYIIDSPVTLGAFEAAYKGVIAAGGDFTQDLPVKPGQGTSGGGSILRLSDDPKVLEPGIPQEKATDPTTRPRLSSEIPVIVERPGHHAGPPGTTMCNVVYMDGHAEALPYPGEWPLTEAMMGTLNRLDALGPQPRARRFTLFWVLLHVPAPITALLLSVCLFAAPRWGKRRRLRVVLVYVGFAAGWLATNGFWAPEPATVRVDWPAGEVIDLPARTSMPRGPFE